MLGGGVRATLEQRTQLLNDACDCDWLRTVHLRHIKGVPQFASFELAGNEDSPEAVTLYGTRFPTLLSEPVAQYQQNSRGLLSQLSKR